MYNSDVHGKEDNFKTYLSILHGSAAIDFNSSLFYLGVWLLDAVILSTVDYIACTAVIAGELVYRVTRSSKPDSIGDTMSAAR